MYNSVNESTNEWRKEGKNDMYNSMNEWMNERTICKIQWMNEGMNERVGKRMKESISKSTNEKGNRFMTEWMHKWTKHYRTSQKPNERTAVRVHQDWSHPGHASESCHHLQQRNQVADTLNIATPGFDPVSCSVFDGAPYRPCCCCTFLSNLDIPSGYPEFACQWTHHSSQTGHLLYTSRH